MAYIEFHQALFTHRKVLKMAGALKMRRAHVLGHLALLWAWALDNAPDGDLSDIDDEAIRLAADWPRKAETFIGAAIYAGFIDNGGGKRVLHDWDQYGGKLVEKRMSDALRKRVRRTSDGHPTDGAGRGEERRVEEKREEERRGVNSRSCRQWFEHVTRRGIGQDKALRQQLDDIQSAHGFDCVAWVWQQAIGTRDPWPYAKRIFDSCLLEGHGPRRRVNGKAQSTLAAGSRSEFAAFAADPDGGGAAGEGDRGQAAS